MKTLIMSLAGLMLAFFETPEATADFELLAQLQGEFDAALQALPLEGVSALPFSIGLIAKAGEDSAIEIPLLLMGYANPLHAMGAEAFARPQRLAERFPLAHKLLLNKR